MMMGRLTTAGLLATTAACARVSEVFEPARFISERSPSVVYVTQRNRAVVTIVNPHVSGDTVVGTVWGENRPLAVPFSDVHSVSAVRVDGVRTTLLALGVTAGAALSAYILFGSANGRNDWFCDYDPPQGRGGAGAPVCGPTT
jgi:hypothetical protein